MIDRFSRWKKPLDSDELLARAQQWFEGERGRGLLSRQQALLNEVVSDYFGYHLLQLSIDARLNLFNNCRVQQKYRCHPFGSNLAAQCDFEQLPFASESLDVVVLHHVQEVVDNPHQLLREIQRVIIPSGHVVLMGFNPWSPMGLYSHIGRWVPGSIAHNHLISAQRMSDWLALLGFETEVCQYGYHCPLFMESTNKPMVDEFLRHWPLGNFYLISAIKRVVTPTAVRPKWKAPTPSFAGMAPIKPRVSSHASWDKLPDQSFKDEEVV